MHLQQTINIFWKRWKHKYLTELREFSKVKLNYDGGDEPTIGDIVFIANNNYKQQDCIFGRIKDLILSRDDKVGAVFVDKIISVKINTIKSPINKLFPIETVKEIDNEKKILLRKVMLS